MKILKKFLGNESGAAIVEYGLALLVVAGVAIAGFNGLSAATNTNVNSACTNVAGAGNC